MSLDEYGNIKDVELVDSIGTPIGTQANKIYTETDSNEGILKEILKCLKLIEIHLGNISEDDLILSDIDDIDEE